MNQSNNKQQAAYSQEVADIMHTLTSLIQADWSPNAISEIMYDELVDNYTTEEHFVDGSRLTDDSPFEKVTSELAFACEHFANALANFDSVRNINYLSRRNK